VGDRGVVFRHLCDLLETLEVGDVEMYVVRKKGKGKDIELDMPLVGSGGEIKS